MQKNGVTCRRSFGTWYAVMSFMLYVICYVLYVMCYMLYVMYYCVNCYVLCLKRLATAGFAVPFRALSRKNMTGDNVLCKN